MFCSLNEPPVVGAAGECLGFCKLPLVGGTFVFLGTLGRGGVVGMSSKVRLSWTVGDSSQGRGQLGARLR